MFVDNCKKKRKIVKLVVHKAEFSFPIGPFFPTRKINPIIRLSLEKATSHILVRKYVSHQNIEKNASILF